MASEKPSIAQRDEAVSNVKEYYTRSHGHEPVQVAEMGEWIIHTEHFTPYRRCNNCGWEMPLIANESEDDRVKFPHCPGCRLPMKGET